MSRRPRLAAPSTVYHVIMRCNNGDFHIKDRQDFIDLLGVVAHYKEKYHFKLYGYCILHSHAHLIVHVPDDEKASISKIMHGIMWRYAVKYNRRHGRKGHLFGERFKSPVVETDSYGVTLLRYIAQNPVRAKMVSRARDWEFSSYRVYEDGAVDPLVDLMPSFLGLAAAKKRSAAMFRELVEGTLLNQDASWSKTYVIGTEVFTKKILGWTGQSSSDPPM
jgi:REP element-mobilizing transposase RayT